MKIFGLEFKFNGFDLWHSGNFTPPTTLPANGGNADTVDTKHASDFATSAQGTKADNALPSLSYTASDVLSKLKTVDGAGSGLDADTVDGVQLSSLVDGLQDDLNSGVTRQIPYKFSIPLPSRLSAEQTGTVYIGTGNVDFPFLRGERDELFGDVCQSGTYAEVLALVESIGARLPTIEELEANVTAMAGCSYDFSICWSQTRCGKDSFYCNFGKDGTELTRVCKNITEIADLVYVLEMEDTVHRPWANIVTQSITNGVTTTSPSEDAVYDALAGKVKIVVAAVAPTTPGPGDFWYEVI